MKFTFDTGSNTISYDTSSADLNQYLLGLNGAFQGAGWKILQSARDNFLTAYNRKNNIVEAYKTDNTTEKFIEPPVQWNLPMKHVVSVANSATDIEIVSPYENVNDNFAGDDLKQTLKDEVKDEEYRFNPSRSETLYEKLLIPPEQVKVKSVEYSDYIFPKKELVGLAETRTKPNYAEVAGTGSRGYDRNPARIRTFWKNSINDRLTKSPYQNNNKTGSINVLNYSEISASGLSPYFNGVIRSYDGMFLSSSNSKRSLWPLENDYTIVLSASTDISTNVGNIYINARQMGDLSPITTAEDRNINGTYVTDIGIASFYEYSTKKINIPGSDLTESITLARHKNSFPRPSPRPQYVYAGDVQSPIDLFVTGTNRRQWKSKIFNLGLAYKTDVLSNNSPWFDTYEDFIEDIKNVSKKYSIIPEYRISEKIENFVKNKNGNFFYTPEEDYLDYYGFESDSKNKFTNSFNAFITKNFFNKNYIKIKANGVKKLLPYNGFYPELRSIQAVDLFRDSFFGLTNEEFLTGSIVVVSGNLGGLTPLSTQLEIDKQVLNVISPFFGPGILFNTFKASLAVSYPALITSSNQEPELFLKQNSKFNYIFDFESLLDINNSIKEEFKKQTPSEQFLYYISDFYYESVINDDPYNAYKIKYDYNQYNKNWTERNPLYRLGINNFLSEIPKFFLKNQKLNNFISKPQKDFGSVISGNTYAMDIFLERQTDQKQILDLSIPLLYGTCSISEASYYGTKVDRSIVGGSWVTSSTSADVAQWSQYTPSYFVGKPKTRIKYTPDFSGKVSLSDVLENLKFEYINEESDKRFELLSNIYGVPKNYFPSYNNRMTLSSSINFKQKTKLSNLKFDQYGNPLEIQDTNDDSLDVWSIQTKFETPLLNFNTELNRSVTSSLFATSSFSGSGTGGGYTHDIRKTIGYAQSLGLWSGYGEIPQSGKGINFGIEESGGTFGSLINLCGFEVGQRDIGAIADSKEISEAVLLIPYVDKGSENFNQNNGLAENIRSIPGEEGVDQYSTTTKGPFYFKVNKKTIDQLITGNSNFSGQFDQSSTDQINKLIQGGNVDKNNSIIRCLNGLVNYVVPPHLDWLRNRSVEPFAMYFLEFKHNLDQQDLADIWQGLMPKIARTAQLDEVSLEHELAENQFFHGKTLPENVKFKVFKVKKRASISYYDLTDDSSDDTRFRFKFGNSTQATRPEYSYNWPYDYFSLVELVNIEAGGIASGSL